MEDSVMSDDIRSHLAEKLESLGSVLKSQIMSDLNAWEERRRNEAQASRSKKFSNKRARIQPLPDLPHTILVGLREIRYILYTRVDVEVLKQVSGWCIGVLAVFVSVADMKGNCKIHNLISLPGVKAVFQLLVVTIETGFSMIGVDSAELGLVTRVIEATKDPRAVAWILNQYGAAHKSSFLKCLHLHLISKTPRSTAMPVAEATGLSQAMNELATAFPHENAQAIGAVLQTYKHIAVDHAVDFASVDEDDSRRSILFYLLQSPSPQQTSIPGLSPTSPATPASAQSPLLPSSSSSSLYNQKQPLLFSILFAAAPDDGSSVQQEPNPIGDCSWIADAIIFEMRSGFSRFLVSSEENALLRPLSQAIEVLFGDTSKAKKVSDQPLDINKVLGVLSLVNTVVQRSNIPKTKSSKNGSEEDGDNDVEMADSEPADGPDYCLEFVDSCRRTLMRLLAREQELFVLNQLPKTVKNMPQPILNGLQEAMQKGGRVYNNGPINIPTSGFNEVDQICKRMFSLLTDIANTARGTANSNSDDSGMANKNLSAQRLYRLICEVAPMLIEVIVSRIDAPALFRSLVRSLVESWPIRFDASSGADQSSVYALYRSLLAISEGNRGLLHRHLLQVLNQDLVKSRRQLSTMQLQHNVDLLASAVEHERIVTERCASLSQTDVQLLPWDGPVFEVVRDLTSALLVSWRLMWAYCFVMPQDDTGEMLSPLALWILRRDLVCALAKLIALPRSLRYIDQLVLMEYALRELVRIQGAMCRAAAGKDDSIWSSDQDDVAAVKTVVMTLAKELMALVRYLAKSSGIERAAMERLLQIALLPDTVKYPDDDEVLQKAFATGCNDSALSTILRDQKGKVTKKRAGRDELTMLLRGQVLSSIQRVNGGPDKQDDGSGGGDSLLNVAERLVWQNAVRPMPKYPRSGMYKHDRTDDAWAFAQPQKQQKRHYSAKTSSFLVKSSESPPDQSSADELVGSNQAVHARWPLVVMTILSLAHQKSQTSDPSGMAVLGQLLEEYYVDSIPSMPPSLLDERLSSGRLQLHPLEMELLHDIRHNQDLEAILFEMLQNNQPRCGDCGAASAKRLASALLVALVVLWSGALGEPTIKRPRDLEFTTRLVAHIVEAYHFNDDDGDDGDDGDANAAVLQRKARSILRVFPLISGGDLARLLHVFVWRWVVHRMPSAEDDSQRLVMHILRRYIIKTSHLFKCFL
ncbi:hypothetical protein EV178_001055 [Coemansia sp. RSA 1646]|nr:hypothetical protein EV178_001055 [Coemansia sp. RSA 1646]